MTSHYTPNFYETIRAGVRSSAETLVPIMADWYAKRLNPSHHPPVPSVVDVGCGEGWWTREWLDGGYASDVTGIDGPWPGAGDALREVEGADFIPIELDKIGPLTAGRGADPVYDVAICLEVAEHLVDPDPFLAWLRKIAPVIMFSAAVPGQPGANHVSCRWQSDWAESFKEAGWYTHDPRPEIWGNPNAEWWYRQNLFYAWDPLVVYMGRDEPILSMIHPEFWEVR